MTCAYKDMLGKPNEGVHSYRIYNIAIVDVILTVVLALIIWGIFIWLNVMNFNIGSFIFVLLTLFIIGVILHKLFCVDTTINRLIFKS